MRLDGQRDARWESRSQFFAVAAQTMRRVLVDHARTRLAQKRGGDGTRVTLGAVDRAGADAGGPAAAQGSLDAVDLLALDDALRRLAELDPKKARLVELRYFAGLSIPETAAAMGISQATVGREWAVARMWLRRELRRGDRADDPRPLAGGRRGPAAARSTCDPARRDAFVIDGVP